MKVADELLFLSITLFLFLFLETYLTRTLLTFKMLCLMKTDQKSIFAGYITAVTGKFKALPVSLRPNEPDPSTSRGVSTELAFNTLTTKPMDTETTPPLITMSMSKSD